MTEYFTPPEAAAILKVSYSRIRYAVQRYGPSWRSRTRYQHYVLPLHTYKDALAEVKPKPERRTN